MRMAETIKQRITTALQLLGLLAAFRQIYLMLVNKGKEAQKEEKRF